MRTCYRDGQVRISIIIPSYNSRSTLVAAVRSVVETGYLNSEIVVVNDQSQDDTLRVAEELAEEYKPMIKVFSSPGHKNSGAAAARNFGLQRATGDLIAFLDADDIFYPNRFAELSRFRDNPQLNGIYGYARVRCVDSEQSREWKDGVAFGTTEPLSGDKLLTWALETGCPWPMSGITVRKTILDELGGFDNHLETAEDSYLWWQLAWIGGIEPGRLEDPVSEYRRRTGSLFTFGMETRIRYFEALNRFRKWCRQNCTATDRIRLIDSVLESQYEKCIYAARHESSRVRFVKTWGMILKAQPSLLARRRHWGHLVYGVAIRSVNTS